MPIKITDPDGRVHEFADGTPTATINAEMSRRWANRNAPPPQPPMPPGTVPSGMQPQSNAPNPNLPPLSEDAQNATNLLKWKTMTGDRSGVTGASDLLKADPTYQARQKFATGMGEQAATLASKQGAGVRVYAAVDELEKKMHAWLDHVPEAFNNAIGPWADNVAGVDVNKYYTSWMHPAAYELRTLMDHDIDKLTALYREMPSSGRGSGSDAQDATFKEAMGQYRKAKTPEMFFAVMQSAKNLIRDKAGLPHDFELPSEGLHPTDIAAINRWADRDKKIGPDSPYVRSRPSAISQPSEDSSSPAIRVQTVEEARRLPSGTRIILPDGRPGQVP